MESYRLAGFQSRWHRHVRVQSCNPLPDGPPCVFFFDNPPCFFGSSSSSLRSKIERFPFILSPAGQLCIQGANYSAFRRSSFPQQVSYACLCENMYVCQIYSCYLQDVSFLYMMDSTKKMLIDPSYGRP
jgi:hypothetical protein